MSATFRKKREARKKRVFQERRRRINKRLGKPPGPERLSPSQGWQADVGVVEADDPMLTEVFLVGVPADANVRPVVETLQVSNEPVAFGKRKEAWNGWGRE